MSCLCPSKLLDLLDRLAAMPPLALGLPPGLGERLLAVQWQLSPPPALQARADLQARAQADLLARVSAMAALHAAVQAAFGLKLAAGLSAQAQADLQARLAVQVGSLNASGPALRTHLPALGGLMHPLAALMPLLGLLQNLLAFGLDLRQPGALAVLQARLHAQARAQAQARADASARASVLGGLMASMGLDANAQGAAQLTAAMQSAAAMSLSLPAITVPAQGLSLLAALMAVLAALRALLQVDLLAPGGPSQLRLALGGLPLAGLAELQVQGQAQAGAQATAALDAAAQATAHAQAQAQLPLAAAARIDMRAAAQLANAVQLGAQAPQLMLAPGSCGGPCPVAPVLGPGAGHFQVGSTHSIT